MKNKNRIYDQIIDLNPKNVQNFWQNRTQKNGLNSVLLGKQSNPTINILRNEIEKELLINILEENLKNSSILDIGCGIGRWADNLIDYYKVYDGIDYINDFIIKNNRKFQNCDNVNFYTMKVENIQSKLLRENYDNIIITGVLMYLNDAVLTKVFKNIKSFNAKNIYIQETISTTDCRLSLVDFYSNELKTEYSAIYRTKKEYKDLFEKHLSNYSVEFNDFLLEDVFETRPMYWVMRLK